MSIPLVLAALTAGCGEDGGVRDAIDSARDAAETGPAPDDQTAPEEPAPEPEPTPEAEAEPAPEPEPEPEPEPTPDPPPDEGDDAGGIPWLAIALLAAVIAALVAVVSRGRRRTGPATRSASGSGPPSIEHRVLGDAQWLHDQLSLQVLAGPGATSEQRWQLERSRVDVTVRTAHRLGSEPPDRGFAELAAAIDSVANGLDTACALRSDATTDPTVVAEAVAVVQRRRQVLLEWIVAVRGRLGGGG